jgi:crossover junction endodeoxyribonuclease RuvC
MIIEDIFTGINVRSSFLLAHLRGALIYLGFVKKIKTISISPTDVKNIITGYGRAQKSQVKEALKYFIKVDTKKMKEDESDAISIGVASFFTDK